MPRDRIITAFILILAFLFQGRCSGPSPVPGVRSQGMVVDIRDMFQAGEDQFRSVLVNASGLQAVWEQQREAVVMVLLEIEWDDGDREQVQQSGILLEKGDLILTAGHGFVIEEGRITAVRIRRPDGWRQPAQLLELVYNPDDRSRKDWALLRVERRPNPAGVSAYGIAKRREQVLILGYSAALGVDSQGRVRRVHESGSTELVPLGLLGRSGLLSPWVVSPEVGTVPLQGISGAPVFNRSGALIGTFSTLSRQRTVTGWEYRFGLTEIPLEAIQRNTI